MNNQKSSSFTIPASEFQEFADYLQNSSGIVLTESKRYLVTSRLSRLMESMQIDSMSILVQQMKAKTSGSIYEMVIDAMTTNETSWFRDVYPFDYFKNQFLSEMQQKNNSNIHVWCAASSTGQEPYSLSMALSEAQKLDKKFASARCSFLATDISRSILSEAESGVFSSLSMQRGLSDVRKSQFFEEKSPGQWHFRDAERQRVKFQYFNLMDKPIHKERFDLVFCRNVLIYFSKEDKKKILESFHAALKQDAYLMLGSTESALDLKTLFKLVRVPGGVVYQKI